MGNTSSNIPAHNSSERERMSPPQQQPAPPPAAAPTPERSQRHSSSSNAGKRRTGTSQSEADPVSTGHIAAKEFKERGNKLYQAQRFDEAINSYTSAIVRDNQDATYFTNRALCYIQLKKFDKAEQDCRRALDLDSKNIKAYYFLGKCCIHFQRYEEAIRALTRAIEFASNCKTSYGDDITNMLRHARRERFKIDEDKRISQEIELQSYLNRLIDLDIENNVKATLETQQENDSGKTDAKIEEMQTKGRKDKEMLNSLFAQVDERRRKREIPDYLCGKISFELLRDPVITPCGITYDRSDIKEHLHRVGHFDPITRVPLTVEQLIPNLAMKEVLENFIIENEWALDI